MSKYEPLTNFLVDRKAEEISMTFAEIERVIDDSLPAAATRHRAWWSNNPSNNVMTKAWLEAGYKTERVDMGSRKLVFVRSHKVAPSARSESPQPAGSILARLRERLAGTVKVAPGVDLTAPTGERWDAERP